MTDRRTNWPTHWLTDWLYTVCTCWARFAAAAAAATFRCLAAWHFFTSNLNFDYSPHCLETISGHSTWGVLLWSLIEMAFIDNEKLYSIFNKLLFSFFFSLPKIKQNSPTIAHVTSDRKRKVGPFSVFHSQLNYLLSILTSINVIKSFWMLRILYISYWEDIKSGFIE